MRIVIVTYNWPPRNAIGTHRPYSWARHWSEAGAEVTVLTARKKAFDAPLDLTLPDLPGVQLLEVPFGGASGLVNTFLKFQVVHRVAKRVMAAVNKRVSRSIDPRMAWRKAAQPVANELAQNVDVVVSTFGPPAAHLIAHDMKQSNRRLLWVADYRDLWSQLPYMGVLPDERARTAQTERDTVGRSADLITAVSQDMVKQLADLTGKQVACIPNGFDINEDVLRARLANIRRQPRRPFRIVHTGTVYDGSRDCRPLLVALAKLKSDNVVAEREITVDFYGSRVGPIRQLADDDRYKPFIRIMGHVPREEALSAQCEADLLLLLESPAPEAVGVLTGKLFEYMAAGRPILGIGSLPEYEIGRVLARTGTGKTFGPEGYDEISAVISATMKGGGMLQHFDPKPNEILQFSRKKIAHNFYDLIIKMRNNQKLRNQK